jgi:transposase-like protein
METALPNCPACGKSMVYYSSDVFSEHYMCAHCDQFLAVERRVGFFAKSPFKPRYPPNQGELDHKP